MSGRGRSGKAQKRSSEASGGQAKRTRRGSATPSATVTSQTETEPQRVEVVHLAGVGDSGTGSGNSQSASGILTKSGPSPRRNFVDFEQILKESALLETTTQPINSDTTPSTFLEPLPLDASPNDLNIDFHFDEESIRLGGEDMTAHVPAQICKKIWEHQYINLSLLLKGNVELQDLCSGGLIHITDQGTIESRPKITKDKVPNIDKWTDAFHIFMSIYLKKYPSKCQELLQYMTIIREAASRSNSLSWRTYDEQFRLRQAHDVQSWGKLNSDLWLRVMSGGFATSTTNLASQSALQQTKGTCYDFNKGTCSWNPCRFIHACSNCGGKNHARVTCFKLQGSESINRGGSTFRRFRGFRPFSRGGRTYNRRGNRQ